MKTYSGWLWNRAPPLLVLAAVLWAGNAVASRMAVGNVSPMTLVGVRWLLISVIMALAAPTAIRASAPLLWRHKGLIALMALVGLAGFNALLYISAHYTTAVNIVLLQCLMPGLVLIAGGFLGARASGTQYAGVVITCLGVAIVATHGSPLEILALQLNFGDVLVLVTCVMGAIYNLMLPRRPKTTAPVYFAALAMASFVISTPMMAAEAGIGALRWPNAVGWGVILFTALGPGIGAQVLFLRGVDLIGPARAGIYNNLTPVFGALLGVFVLGETFAGYHAVGLALVLAGIWMGERGKRLK